jgi:type IV pilus assembly protein PilB
VSTPLRERPDAPLGTLIFRAGLLPAETIESALEEGVKTGKRLGEILTERGLLKEVDLARLLAGQKGLDFVPVREHIVDPAAASLFTHDQARLFRALPYAFEEGVPVIAIPDPTDEVVLRNIREAIGREDVRFVVSTRGELAEIVEDVYSKPLAVPDKAAAEPAPAPPAPAEEEPSFVQNPDPPAPPTVEAPPDPV